MIETEVEKYDRMTIELFGEIQERGPTHRHMQRIVGNMLGRLDYASILDIGSGRGHGKALLTKGRDDIRYTGCDISGAVIEQAKAERGGDFRQLDVTQGHFDEKWDLVYSALLLEHVEADVEALANMRAMATKHVLVTAMAGNFERYRKWDEKIGHVRNYQVGELEAKLEQVGLKPRDVVYWGFPFYSPILRTLQEVRQVGLGDWNPVTRFIANALYYLFYLNSSRKGDLLIALADV